jgi:class 3 adenylate cyclase
LVALRVKGINGVREVGHDVYGKAAAPRSRVVVLKAHSMSIQNLISSKSVETVGTPTLAKLETQKSSLTRQTSKLSLAVTAEVEHVRIPRWYDDYVAAAKKALRPICKALCGSKVFATITTLLTIYALFGDDLRLMFATLKEDKYLDIITIVAMCMFAIEIFAFIGGKPEYLFGFFFWLDILSTVTLVLDVTTISEALFGDSITKASPSEGGSGGGGGNSAEAARAARMSRAGTKAGRVVRLIRLLRLIKMLKVFREKKKEVQSFPGEDWDEEEEDSNVQESAVSKKLSEMTTRRVIVLVLTIMLALPAFRPEMYNNNLDSAGQYGLNIMYRRWRDGLYAHEPLKSASNAAKYMESKDRRVYEDLLLHYIYKHNWFLHSGDVPSGKASPADSFNRLFWLGATPSSSPLGKYLLPNRSSYNWNSKWSGHDWGFFSGNVPEQIQTSLTMPWNTSTSCVMDIYRGRSLIAKESGQIACPEELRYQERTVVFPQWLSPAEAAEITFMFVFDRREGSQFEAFLNLLQTLFVCLLLGVGSMTFAQDANKLVLAPIERMISKLERIRNNPLEALKIGDEEHHKEQAKIAKMADDEGEAQERSRCKRLLGCICPCCRRRLGLLGEDAQAPEPMETQVLETTILKIGQLLALGFGEAGAKIIGQNMNNSDSSAVTGMIPGRTVEAVFAFCDIKDFTDATDVLQDQVMIFVNRIAAIIHSICDEFWGNPNKNVGEAFLLVWRLSGHDEKNQHRLTDMSLLSLISMVAKVATSAEIAEYRIHAKLLKRLPNYRTKMGFGLHLGWAIEGAIGSEFKIDASYLSPHVNMAARLESETKYYGSHIILSDAVAGMLSEAVRDECRLIDTVDLTGGQPIKLYTVDLDDESLVVDRPKEAIVSKTAKFKIRWERQRRKNERWYDESGSHKLFLTDPRILLMRSNYTEEFVCRFKMAYLNYEAGNWPIAAMMLQETRYMLPSRKQDGASKALLRFLQMYDNNAPNDWHGFRKFGDAAPEAMITLDDAKYRSMMSEAFSTDASGSGDGEEEDAVGDSLDDSNRGVVRTLTTLTADSSSESTPIHWNFLKPKPKSGQASPPDELQMEDL